MPCAVNSFIVVLRRAGSSLQAAPLTMLPVPLRWPQSCRHLQSWLAVSSESGEMLPSLSRPLPHRRLGDPTLVCKSPRSRPSCCWIVPSSLSTRSSCALGAAGAAAATARTRASIRASRASSTSACGCCRPLHQRWPPLMLLPMLLPLYSSSCTAAAACAGGAGAGRSSKGRNRRCSSASVASDAPPSSLSFSSSTGGSAVLLLLSEAASRAMLSGAAASKSRRGGALCQLLSILPPPRRPRGESARGAMRVCCECLRCAGGLHERLLVVGAAGGRDPPRASLCRRYSSRISPYDSPRRRMSATSASSIFDFLSSRLAAGGRR
eukprot:m.305219 g.305219  ORF g.305219 m.305219 type:complete len:323 (+) comp17611_c0_seq1:1055-2023(+)